MTSCKTRTMGTALALLLAALVGALVARALPCAISSERPSSRSPLSVILFAGGDEDNPFAQTIAAGARAAAQDLDVDLSLVWSGWDMRRMTQQFRSAMAVGPDGIAIMGHPGEAALAPLIDEAQRAGIVVTSLNVGLPETERRLRTRGFGYAGQNIAEHGERMARAALTAFDIPSGSQVLLIGVKQYPIRGLRTRSAEKALLNAGMEVLYLQRDGSDEEFLNSMSAQLAEHPQIRLLVIDTDTGLVGQHLRDTGIEPGAFQVVGFDLSSSALELMRQGHIDLLADQQPFLQGYLAVLQLAMTRRYGFAGLHIDTGTGFVHRGNIDQVAPMVERGIR